jgi:hypothetical protein
MTTRKPPKALNKSAADIAANARAERERKAASKAALKTERKTDPVPAKLVVTEDQAKADARHAQDRANAVATAKADAEATGTTFEAMCADMGIDEHGAPIQTAKVPYNGPMLALVAARKAYIKAANGIACNGDKLATLCGQHTRDATVRALIRALGLPGNPYAHLNPGQQSMNLRNKARHAVNNGFLSFAQIEAAYAAI